MNKSRLIWGIICLALAALLAVQTFATPGGKMLSTLGDTNVPIPPITPAIILGIVGIVLLATAGSGTPKTALEAQPKTVQDEEKVALTIGTILLIVAVAGCTSQLPTPAPSTATDTPLPPTATGTPLPPTATGTSLPPTTTETPLPPTSTAPLPFTLAAQAEDLIGTWRRPSGFLKGLLVRFYDDGTYHLGFSLSSLDSMPIIANAYAFDGPQIRVMEISIAGGLTSCGSDVGIYEVRLLEGGGIQIVVINDPCFTRRSDYPGVYEAVP